MHTIPGEFSSNEITIFGCRENGKDFYEFFHGNEIVLSLTGYHGETTFHMHPNADWCSLAEHERVRGIARDIALELFPGITIVDQRPFDDVVIMTDADLVVLRMRAQR